MKLIFYQARVKHSGICSFCQGKGLLPTYDNRNTYDTCRYCKGLGLINQPRVCKKIMKLVFNIGIHFTTCFEKKLTRTHLTSRQSGISTSTDLIFKMWYVMSTPYMGNQQKNEFFYNQIFGRGNYIKL